jgi:Spy/CpxP family protein refolding chaperone
MSTKPRSIAALAAAGTIAAGLALAGGIPAKAFADRGGRAVEKGEWHKDWIRHKLDRWSQVLDLTDSQRAQIESILESERPNFEPAMQTLRETRHELRKAMQSGAAEEAEIRALAEKRAQAETELIVGKARVQSKVFALLTPDQQSLVKKLRPLMGEGRHRRGFGGGLGLGGL